MIAALARFLLALGLLGPLTLPAAAEPVTVTAVPVETFKGARIGEPVGDLIWRGGLVLSSDDSDFGGLSGLTFTDDEPTLAMVTDRGRFISGQLLYDSDGQPVELVGVTKSAIENSKGNALPPNYSRDAEAIETIYRNGVPARVRVGFENLTRVADFDLVDGRPTGAAVPVNIPGWLEELRSNRSLEAACIAPPASPIAGSTLLITEDIEDAAGEHAAWLLGVKDRGALGLKRTPGLNPTDCAFLPDGSLLVLERGVGLFSFTMQIRQIAAGNVMPGARLDGPVILSAAGADIDNMEGLTVHPGPAGETRITLLSDDNFNDWERTLLLEFALRGPASTQGTDQ